MPPLARSTLFAVLVACATLVLFVASYSGDGPASDAAIDRFVCDAAREWRVRYGGDSDLQIVISDVRFRDTPGEFVRGEAIVVAPIAVSLAGAQEVIEVRASPPPSRMLEVEGTRFSTWEYAGTVHREMRFTGVALVKRARSSSVASPALPTFDQLPQQLKTDTLLNARELQEHNLDTCKTFEAWVAATAGDPPYTAQLLRLVAHVSDHRDRSEQERGLADDICHAVRTSRFSEHQAIVAAVMGLRQLGAPALGFSTADGPAIATFADGIGWISLELKKDAHYRAGGAPILTTAPIVGRFEASIDGMWSPAAGAYARSSFGVQGISFTEWRPKDGKSTDETTTRSMPLREVCP